MGLLLLRGFGGNVLRGWIRGYEMLVDVSSFKSELTLASPFLGRTLKTGYTRLQGLVRETVIGSRDDLPEGYNGPELVLMLQSIASIVLLNHSLLPRSEIRKRPSGTVEG
jgi:hypothetical protein